MDKDFVKALNPSVNKEALERGLVELYKRINAAFRLWIEGSQ